MGGWVLRANDGVTRRANSVLTVGEPDLPLDHALKSVVDFYVSRGLPVMFQMTEASLPSGLDRYLEQRRFEREMTVQVQTMDLKGLADTGGLSVELSERLTEHWLRTYGRAEGYDDSSLRVRRGILDRINGEKIFASCKVEGDDAGVGVGVIEGDWLGLFAIATKVEHRRSGVASSIIGAIGRWALEKGAQHVYLQVESQNYPALALYHKLGFRTAYVYWYRALRD